MKSAFQTNTCRLCLKVGVKVHKLAKTPHKGFIENMLKLKGFNLALSDDHHVCYICLSLLNKTSNFINMVLNAQKVLYRMIKSSDSLTVSMLENIDRNQNGLNIVSLTSATFIAFSTNDASFNSIKKNNINKKTVDVNRKEIKTQNQQTLQNKEGGLVKISGVYSLNKECIEISDSSDTNEEEPFIEQNKNLANVISTSTGKMIVVQPLPIHRDSEAPNDLESVSMKNIPVEEPECIFKIKKLSEDACKRLEKRLENSNLTAVDKKMPAQPVTSCIETELANSPESESMMNDSEAEELETLNDYDDFCSKSSKKRLQNTAIIGVDKIKSAQMISTYTETEAPDSPEFVSMMSDTEAEEPESLSDDACSKSIKKRLEDTAIIAVDEAKTAQMVSTFIEIEELNGSESLSMLNDTKVKKPEGLSDDACSQSSITCLENNEIVVVDEIKSPQAELISLETETTNSLEPESLIEDVLEDNDVLAVDKRISAEPVSIHTETKAKKRIIQKNNTKSKKQPIIDDTETSISDSESECSGKKSCKNRPKDEDYQPDSTSHSEDTDYDCYDDKGHRMKKPKRTYPRICDDCDYEIPVGKEHYRHYMFEHPNIKYPYPVEKDRQCSVCGKLYGHNMAEKHEEYHSNMEIKCPYCPKICQNKIRWRAHIFRAHPKSTLICDYCSKEFKTKTDIVRHIRIHTGEKPFKCHICDAAFAHSGNRTLHIRTSHQNYSIMTKKKIKKENQKVRRRKKNIENQLSDEVLSQLKAKKPKRKRKMKKANANKNMKSEDTEKESSDEVLSQLKTKKAKIKRKIKKHNPPSDAVG